MRTRIVLLVVALALLATSAAHADTSFMPTVQQETGGLVVRAHVLWQDWRPIGAGLSGYCVAAYDEDGNELGHALSDSEGDAIFDVDPHTVITLRLSGDDITPMSVTVLQGAGPLAVSFWMRTQYSPGEPLIAASWPMLGGSLSERTAEQVYIQQSLRAMRVLGWNRGAEWDSYVDWQVGMAYVFAPQTVGRGDLDMTQGQRFAAWWAGYCPVNCDNPVTEELRAELAADFDAAMGAIQ
jgi:hypothetical protein